MAAIPTHARSNSERGLKLPHLSLLVSALLPLDPATHPPHPIMSDLEARVQKILDDATVCLLSPPAQILCSLTVRGSRHDMRIELWWTGGLHLCSDRPQRRDPRERESRLLPLLLRRLLTRFIAQVASGYEELGNHSRPAKQDSLYCLYSCTKAIATIAVMQLVEQGKISLDDHVGDKVPQVAAATLADGSKPNKPITLRHLLTHTAGFGYTFFEPAIKRWSERAGIDEFSGTLEGITSPLIAQPGEDWNYGVRLVSAARAQYFPQLKLTFVVPDRSTSTGQVSTSKKSPESRWAPTARSTSLSLSAPTTSSLASSRRTRTASSRCTSAARTAP